MSGSPLILCSSSCHVSRSSTAWGTVFNRPVLIAFIYKNIGIQGLTRVLIAFIYKNIGIQSLTLVLIINGVKVKGLHVILRKEGK